MSIQFKNIDKNDYLFLREMLYDALYLLDNEKTFPKIFIDLPELSKYIENWGEYGDIGLIAQHDNVLIGAVWGRLFKEKNQGFGFVDNNIPEILMAITGKYRNQGLGAKLLTKFFKVAKEHGYKALSLSVDKRNRAFDLYKRMGFEIVDNLKTTYTMKKEL